MRMLDIPVPEIYKSSSDFRFFMKWFATALEKTQYDIENFLDLYDPERCPKDLLWALADTMGFKYDDRLPTSFNRLVLLYFMSMIYNRGSRMGMMLAGEVNLAQLKILMLAQGYTDENGEVHEAEPILYDRLEDTSVPANSVFVSSNVAEGYIDVVYFSTKKPLDACIEYVRPVGMYVFQNAGVRFDSRTKISVDPRLTNDSDRALDYSPTFVGHYRRSDYASLQPVKLVDDPLHPGNKIQEPTTKRQNVWYRNSKVEGQIPTEDYAGWRSLYSLQLSNNEQVVKALIDPIFSLGHSPFEGAPATVSDDYLNTPDTPEYNLRYDITTDEQHTRKSTASEYAFSVIDKDRSPRKSGKPTPVPAINPPMESTGDALFKEDSDGEFTDNSSYWPNPNASE